MARKPEPEAVPERASDLPALPVVEVAYRGRTITMRKFTTREYLAIRRRSLSDVELVEMTLGAIVEYVPGEDPLDLGPDEIIEDILGAWIASKVAEVLPPPTA